VKEKYSFQIFSSKSNTLKILQNKLNYSKIEKIFDFTVDEWNDNKSNILNALSKNFEKNNVIVRSSAKGEDSHDKSEAGNYDSVQNINASSKKQLQNAINKVIKSYEKKGNFFPNNQILIQKQTSNIISSGVAFTRSPNNQPYYIINFDDGSSTDSVTKGEQSNLIKIFRNLEYNKIPNKWKLLIKSFKEIEKITKTDWLDIEFGITKNKKIVIFQVRPLIAQKKILLNNIDEKISKKIQTNKKKYEKLSKSKNLFRKKIIFSDMSDWNPAEILGDNPNLLDYSLYDFLIMEKIWQKGRTVLGYYDIYPTPLMVKFGNKPYVDVRASFTSLIPKEINNKLKNKLMKFYFDKLEKNPHLHDKVEFDILFTCYDLTLDKRIIELKKYGFSKIEISTIKNILIKFTNRIINDFPNTSKQCNNSIIQMSKNRKKIISELNKSNRSHISLLTAAEKLLRDCRNFGTLPFSTMARIAFIGSILLKSLKTCGYLDSRLVEKFMMSITTPLSEIQNDVEGYLTNKISKKDFLKKYGHLRPGTYDITALRYDNETKFFDRIKFLKQKKISSINIDEKYISHILQQHNLQFTQISFLNFIKNGLIQREKLKFEFTKNLSESLELIAEAGNKMNFTRNDLAHLDISTILKNKNKNHAKTIWKNMIKKNIERKKLNNLLISSPLIFSKKDFEILEYYISNPNYITSKKIVKNIIKLKNYDAKIHNLTNKIILIENADPGYDWIFTRNPSGLITKYGGVASHMAIRCSELGLPAAIGCGEILFEKLLNSNKVLLDCKNTQIIILEHTIHDEYLEKKKILKSLGYIK